MRKTTNIIIFSVPESDSIVSEERVEHDEKFVIEFLNTIKCDTLNVKKIFRLGQKRERPRPMKVCFDSEESKTSVLKNCRFLKGNQNYRDINISRDMTFS